MNTRILLVDDFTMIRETLRTLLETQPFLEVVGDTDDGRKALELVRKLSPDIVIMDVTMPSLNGIEATHKIISEFPNVKVIALSLHHEQSFVAAMLSAGALGYVLKESLFDELVQAIRTVADGKVYLSSKIDKVVLELLDS
jgi:DNA-binding NarL/FixJ family response regulator